MQKLDKGNHAKHIHKLIRMMGIVVIVIFTIIIRII